MKISHFYEDHALMITLTTLRVALFKINYWERLWEEAIDILHWLADWYPTNGDYDTVRGVVRRRRRSQV